ncbi:hypothetical protein KCU67_g5993, partial [Aureobasidium melanogenum]
MSASSLPGKILFARYKNLKTSADPLHLVSRRVRQETIALEKYELGISNWYHTNNLDFHALRTDYKDEFNADSAIDINEYLGGASPTTLRPIPILAVSRTNIGYSSCSTMHLRMRPLSGTRCRRGKKHESCMSTPWAVNWIFIRVMHDHSSWPRMTKGLQDWSAMISHVCMTQPKLLLVKGVSTVLVTAGHLVATGQRVLEAASGGMNCPHLLPKQSLSILAQQTIEHMNSLVYSMMFHLKPQPLNMSVGRRPITAATQPSSKSNNEVDDEKGMPELETTEPKERGFSAEYVPGEDKPKNGGYSA